MDNTVNLLGLALRAGRLEAGEDCARDACRAKACRLLLVAQDASAGTARRAMFAAGEGACLCLTVPYTRDELGRALGMDLCAVAAVTDTGLAEAFVKKLAAQNPERYGEAAQRLRIKAERARQRKSRQSPKRRAKRT